MLRHESIMETKIWTTNIHNWIRISNIKGNEQGEFITWIRRAFQNGGYRITDDVP